MNDLVGKVIIEDTEKALEQAIVGKMITNVEYYEGWDTLTMTIEDGTLLKLFVDHSDLAIKILPDKSNSIDSTASKVGQELTPISDSDIEDKLKEYDTQGFKELVKSDIEQSILSLYARYVGLGVSLSASNVSSEVAIKNLEQRIEELEGSIGDGKLDVLSDVINTLQTEIGSLRGNEILLKQELDELKAITHPLKLQNNALELDIDL